MVEWWKHILRGPIPASVAVGAGFALLASWLASTTGGAGEGVARFYDPHGALEPEAGANITAADVGGYESASVHHLCVAEGVKTHLHRTHDETVTILSGEGRMRLGDETRDVRGGMIVLIPRGTLHSLEVASGEVCAVSLFSPAFDGKDRVYVDD